MRTARLLTLLAAMLTLAVGAGSARSADSAPTGLHGFLLRADEPCEDELLAHAVVRVEPGARRPRTTSSSSRSAIRSATTRSSTRSRRHDAGRRAAAHPAVDHAARRTRSMRACARSLPDGATPWSANFGFDMVPRCRRRRRSRAIPGCIRWTPVEGAAGYQVLARGCAQDGSARPRTRSTSASSTPSTRPRSGPAPCVGAFACCASTRPSERAARASTASPP